MFVGFNECKHWWGSFLFRRKKLSLWEGIQQFLPHFLEKKYFYRSSESNGRVGWARNMKSMWSPSAAIFFMTYFYRAGGRQGSLAPWIRYCYSLLCTHSFSCLMEQKLITFLSWKNSVVLAWTMRLRMATYLWLMFWMCTLNRTYRCKTRDLESIMKFLPRKISSVSAACLTKV